MSEIKEDVKCIYETSYTLDSKEYGQYKSAQKIRFGFKEGDKKLSLIPIICILIAVMSIILALINPFGKVFPNSTLYIIALDAVVVAALTYFWVIPVIIRKKASVNFMQNRDIDYRHEMNISIFEDGVKYKLNNINGYAKWKDCKGISESNLIMVILLNNDFSVVIPKRYFKQDPELTIYKTLSKQLINYYGKKYIYHKSL